MNDDTYVEAGELKEKIISLEKKIAQIIDVIPIYYYGNQPEYKKKIYDLRVKITDVLELEIERTEREFHEL